MAVVLCSEEGCNNPSWCRTACRKHWKQWRRGVLGRDLPLSAQGARQAIPKHLRPPKPPCTVAGCEEPQRCKDLCQRHYHRFLKHGDPLVLKLLRGATPLERFMSHVEKTDSCWLWTGTRSGEYGYGNFGVKGKTKRAHRFAYEALVGPIPEGIVLDHLCRTPNCVRPEHLQPVTTRENIVRGMEHLGIIHPGTVQYRGNPVGNGESCLWDRSA